MSKKARKNETKRQKIFRHKQESKHAGKIYDLCFGIIPEFVCPVICNC